MYIMDRQWCGKYQNMSIETWVDFPGKMPPRKLERPPVVFPRGLSNGSFPRGFYMGSFPITSLTVHSVYGVKYWPKSKENFHHSIKVSNVPRRLHKPQHTRKESTSALLTSFGDNQLHNPLRDLNKAVFF